MKIYSEQELEINRLRMDENNPRHPAMESQREIISWMISGEPRIGEKLFALAKDIVEYGINPLDKVCVVPADGEGRDYVVIEGNRRVTAIKLLNNPDSAPTVEWRNKFSKLRSLGYTSIRKIPCVIYNDAKIAFHFIEIKHLGESNGAGTVSWNSQQKSRHEKRVNRKSRQYKALQVLDFIRSQENIDIDTRNLTDNNFPITTLDRLLSDVEFRNFLGLSISEDGDIQFKIEPREAVKPIVKVIRDFGSGRRKVGHVINKEKREEYKNEFGKEDLPDYAKLLLEPVAVDSSKAVALVTGGVGMEMTKDKRYQDPRDRKYLVIPGTVLPIDPKKYNRAKRIFEEMRRLPLKDGDGKSVFPNAGILLLRLFLEISVSVYIHEHALSHPNPKGWKDVSLTEKTKAVLKDLEGLGLLDSQAVKVVNKALSEPGKISNPNSLNDFAHNRNQIPNPNDLIDIWDSYTGFLRALWKKISS